MRIVRGSRRDVAHKIIGACFPVFKDQFPELSSEEILSKISKEMYPWGARAYSPYKVWLSEIKRWKTNFEEKQTQKEIPKEQMKLFDT